MEQKLEHELQELQEQNEVLEFRILELEESNEKVSLSTAAIGVFLKVVFILVNSITIFKSFWYITWLLIKFNSAQ